MSIKSAERTLLLLEYIAKNQPITMRDLRQQLDIPRSSLHGLLVVLQDFGFLAVGPQGEYSIGLRAFEIGSAWAQSVNVETAAQPVLRRLVDEVKQIAHVGVLDGTDIVYIMKQENARPVRLVSAVGRRIPAHATALGKVLMAPLSPEAIRARYPSGQLPRMTGTTIVNVDDLVAAVEIVRRTGLCIDEGESTPGVTCFAAPIHGRRQELLAALSVSVIDSDPDIRDKSYYADAVTRAAAEISAALGGTGVRP
jgi:DNA-binding IclR family transcriptional regulator